MNFAIRFLLMLGVAALLFGILAFHVIPYWIILPSMGAAQRATVDRSVLELEWVNRGFYGLGTAVGLFLAALVPYLVRMRRTR